MNGSERCFNTQHDDQTLDLTPAAKVEVISDIAAVLGPVRGLNTRRFAELVDERFSLGDVAWLNIKRQIHRAVDFPVIIGWQAGPGEIWPACGIGDNRGVSLFRQSNWLAQIKHDVRACLDGGIGGKGPACQELKIAGRG